ncbi:hypothetical protein G0Q06_04635 [Puniceicoccales bacterium CK1056]|uniref:Uncharacterized protein n=1 Tax=Oceanipulchritudo coccoides TaxID=2706888 RepID=A0A6B2M094_9BACT|nr:hypothetical protein [Oceanipulchritudo coccoides]NDV61729.1 hypothetical protein [Oceanipulchritudo coccoides]
MTLLPFETICSEPNNLNTNWDPEVGLWYSPGPGHTFAVQGLERVHIGRAAANRLLNAAAMNRLDEIESTWVLKALRNMQDLDPDSQTYGCMRWYAEETKVDDTNAAFFIGLPLIVIKSQYSEQLEPDGLEILDTILGDLQTWFVGAVYDHPRVYYPNKFLGDLVCAWLLLDRSGNEEQMSSVANEMLKSANYWTEHGWGWGEHMSDGYTGVCLNELSLLLCLSENLPEPVRGAYTGLINDLLTIEDIYGGLPRVPAVRSYAFTNSPKHQNYRDIVRDWRTEEFMAQKDSLNLGHILNNLDWHNRVAPRKPQGTHIQIKCFNNNFAQAWLQDDIRVGSLSAFPLMPTAEHNGWGLAWQSFPVALWKPEGDWGFLQWLVEEDGSQRAHPAIEWGSAYLNNALSEAISPPIVGQTYTLQHQGNILVLRILPATDMNWEMAADQYRIINNHGEIEALSQKGNWSQLLLDYEGRQVSINHIDLMDLHGPALQENEFGGIDWRVTWPNKDLQAPPANELGKHMLIGIWGISIDGKITSAPELIPLETVPMQRNPEQQPYVLKWKWPGIDWHVEIDPLSPNPLKRSLPAEAAYDFKLLKELPKPENTKPLGEHIKRTMHLLSTSTKERPNKVKILFYGQSITRQDYSREIIEAQLREQFPHAQLEVLNPAIGGYEAPRSLLTMHHTLIPEQPDLVVFHVYSGEEDGTYEEILRQIRTKTSAELICVTHHLDNYGPEIDAKKDKASQLRRELAEKYGAELVEVREEWREYIKMHDLKVHDFLVDKIHLNTHGGELWGALQARHFQVQPGTPVEWEDKVTRIDLRDAIPSTFQYNHSEWNSGIDGLSTRGENATLTIPFKGSRVDVISHTGSGQAEIRVDGKRPSELLSNWAATLPSPTPFDYRPAIMRVMLHGQPIKEKWTVTVESCSDDGNEFSYAVKGSVSGHQGSGDHTGNFLSDNGVIELRPEWFTMEHVIRIKNEPIPTPFEITWEVYPMLVDVWDLSPRPDNPSGQTTLIQCLPHGEHELEIQLVEGALSLEQLLNHRYSTKK